MPVQAPLATDLDHILLQCEDVLKEMAGERLFLTGGTGFFGGWLLSAISHANRRVGANIKVSVLARDPVAFIARRPDLADDADISWMSGDICNFSFPQGQFAFVIHAATSTLGNEPPIVLFNTIVEGTRRILDFAMHCDASHLLFASSGAIYGRQPEYLTHIPEDYGGAPDCTSVVSTYGEAKRAAELLCGIAGASGTFAPKIARCFAFLGPGLPLDAHFAAGNFIRDALAAKEIKISGDGSPLRSYLHPADLVVWLLRILLRGVAMRPYNVGSDRAVTIAHLAESVARYGNVGVHVCQPMQPGIPHRYVPDIARARHELGLEVNIELDDAIARTFAWHRNLAGRDQIPGA